MKCIINGRIVLPDRVVTGMALVFDETINPELMEKAPENIKEDLDKTSAISTYYYQSLYRKYRPRNFEEVIGQNHITKTLINQIKNDKIGHAYLFCGSRGTGKTSAAKGLARAINCLNPKDGEPCNECEICKAAIQGSLTDIVEMDAASNNSVEDIRSIREEVNFLPTIAKYRVYIIDEVHMLSTGAFNALLKTLEEPPEHVKFILATTEPQKLPATILSRCQRFDFKRISNENIIKRLKIVCKESNIEITDEALNTIAILSEGAMRDALSILERCVQDGVNNIDDDYIKELVGIPKLAYIKQIIEGILNYNIEQVLENINLVLKEGKDVTNFVWELIKFAKDLLIFKTSNKLDLYSKEDLEDIDRICKTTDKERLLKVVYDLSELENNIKMSSQKTIIFQAGLIKLCNKEQGNSNSDLERRIKELEDKLRNGVVQAPVQNNVRYSAPSVQQTTSSTNTAQLKTESKPVSSAKKGPITQEWTNILNDFKNNGKIMLYTNLLNTNAVEINDMTIGIEFPNGMTPFGKTVLERPENKNELIKQVSIVSGKEMNVKYIDLKVANANVPKEETVESMMNGLDIPFNVID